jgi:hypothetical protein
LNRTVSVSLITEPEVLEEYPVALVPSMEENGTPIANKLVFPEEPILALTLSSEPESVIGPQAEGSGVALAESNETPATISTVGTADLEESNDDMSETFGATVRTTYMMWHDESETDENMLTWMIALNVTGAMVPGFVDGYFRIKKEERDQVEEEQEEESNGEGQRAEEYKDSEHEGLDLGVL